MVAAQAMCFVEAGCLGSRFFSPETPGAAACVLHLGGHCVWPGGAAEVLQCFSQSDRPVFEACEAGSNFSQSRLKETWLLLQSALQGG